MVYVAYWAANGELSQAEWTLKDGGALKDAESTFRSARATFLVFVANLSIQQRGTRERSLGPLKMMLWFEIWAPSIVTVAEEGS